MYLCSCGLTTKRVRVISVIRVIVSSEIHDRRARRAAVMKKIPVFDSRMGFSSCNHASYAKVLGQSLGSESTYLTAGVCYFPKNRKTDI
jgi:hypothetical protein